MPQFIRNLTSIAITHAAAREPLISGFPTICSSTGASKQRGPSARLRQLPHQHEHPTDVLRPTALVREEDMAGF